MRLVPIVLLVLISGCVYQFSTAPPPIQRRVESTVTKTCLGFSLFIYRDHKLITDGNLSLVLLSPKAVEITDVKVEDGGKANTPLLVKANQIFKVIVYNPSVGGKEKKKYNIDVKIVYESEDMTHTESAICSGVYEDET